jgi:methionyl-tRNA formyltransferase
MIFYIIGKGIMLEKCKEFLIKKGHKVRNVKNNLNVIVEKKAILLSIMNEKIINSSFINQFDLAVNFHNAPLPKYAGLYSSTFAVLKKEKIWGATWHILNNKIDCGDIVVQKKFKISEDLSAYELDLLSMYHGYKLFEKLLKLIERNFNFKLIRQNMKSRTYYGKKHHNFLLKKSLINKNYSIKKINRIIKAFDVSKNKKNKIIYPKIKINNKIFILINPILSKEKIKNNDASYINQKLKKKYFLNSRIAEF